MAAVQLLTHTSSPLATSYNAMTMHHHQVHPAVVDDVDSDDEAAGYFAFARIKGEVCLVQVSTTTPLSSLTPVSIKLFRHEFISIFRFSSSLTLHPSDISIIERIDDRLTRYEEENETVFLARGVMERMRKLTMPVSMSRMKGMNTSPRQSRMQAIQRQRQR